MTNNEVIEQMRSKYPERGRRMPARVERKQCVDGLGGLREDLKGLERGVVQAQGASGTSI